VGGNCAAYYVTLGVGWVLGYMCTSLLFFFRVRALYQDNPLVKAFFLFLWLCVVAGTLTVPISLGTKTGKIVPGEPYCISTGGFPAYTAATFIVPVVYDTLVFAFISYRLFPKYEVSLHATAKERIVLFFSGEGLPRMSRALLQSGQQYYLLSAVFSIFTLAFYLSPSVPAPYHVMITLVLLNIVNSSACKVYRDIKFGRISQTSIIDTRTNGSTLRAAVRTIGGSAPYSSSRPKNNGDLIVDVNVSTHFDSEQTRDGTDINLNETNFKRGLDDYGA